MDHYDVYLKGKHFALYTDNKPVSVLKPVHVKTLHRLEENLRAFDFEIIYRKGNEMLSDFSSRQIVNLSRSTTDKWKKIRIEKSGSDNSKIRDSMELNVLI